MTLQEARALLPERLQTSVSDEALQDQINLISHLAERIYDLIERRQLSQIINTGLPQ